MSRTHHHKEQKHTHVGHDYGSRYKCNKSYGAAYGKDSRKRAHSELRTEDKEVVRNELDLMEDSQCVCHCCIRENNIKAGDGDDWFSQLPYNATYMILCPKCGNKRCPKASDHRLECSGSNEPGQIGSIY